MKKRFTGLLIILFAILFIPTNEVEAATVDDIRFYVEMYYYGDQPENLNNMKTIEEITDALDKYSRYMTPAAYKEYQSGTTLASAGQRVATQSESVVEAVVSSSLLYGDIGYIKIAHFPANLSEEVSTHWKGLQQQGATELIIDLRYNGGGYVTSAEQLLGFFQGAPIAYMMSTRERESIVQTKSANTKFPNKPYILVNGYSASASEIVAISLQDQKAATIVGGQTTGKATIQSLYEFDDGSALKLTTGMFTGPNGTVVQGGGVIPDMQTNLDEELTTLHHKLLEQQLVKQGYTKLEETKYKKKGQTLQVNLPYKMNFTGAYPSNKTQLVELGDKRIQTTLAQQQERLILNVTPSRTRLSSAGYIVIIDPTMKRLNGKRINTKMYTTATVE